VVIFEGSHNPCVPPGGGAIHPPATQDEVTLKTSGATVTVTELASGKRRVAVRAAQPGLHVSRATCETAYPVELIQKILDSQGPGWLCDEIEREESPDYVGNTLHWALLSYLDEARFRGARILDFGCGCGASTALLGRMFPDAEVVGIDLMERNLAVARARAVLYGNHVTFLCSPAPGRLPEGIGTFDFVSLTGVYEHLLPAERATLMPQLWALLKPGGVLFLHKTPHRYFPIEAHTTRLPLINYLPDRLALACVRTFARRFGDRPDWPTMLRKGIRGGSVAEIVRMLGTPVGAVTVLRPERIGVRDSIDLWYRSAATTREGTQKRMIHAFCRVLKAVTGIELPPYLAIALEKTGGP
jgi:2-polyprenyl-3-methyl-5-hydroxy-6-metoxy-1,4-benzoquinol methylase